MSTTPSSPLPRAPSDFFPGGRLPSLDGWRAVSIALVLGAHAHYAAGFPPGLTNAFDWLFDGNLGVRFFFVLSGFLITWLLLLERRRTGAIHLGNFYARRAVRILPVYFAFIFVLALLQGFTPFSQSWRGWIGNLTFTTDFFPGRRESFHLWSLSVEEQFYLLWPCLLLACFAARRPLRRAFVLLAVPLVAAPIFRVLIREHWHPHALSPLFNAYSFFAYFDSLAVGCLGALLFFYARKEIARELESRFGLWLGCALVLLLVPHALTTALRFGLFTVPLGDTCQGAAILVLLLQSLLFPARGFYRALNWGWVRWVGALSYSLYLWQQLFWSEPRNFGLGPVWWMSSPGWIVSTFAAACLSYYGLERPLLGLRARLRREGMKEAATSPRAE